MDLITALLVSASIMIAVKFGKEFMKARKELIADLKSKIPVFRIETDQDMEGKVLMLFDHKGGKFLTQGRSAKDLFVFMETKYLDQLVRIISDDRTEMLQIKLTPKSN